MAKEVHVSPKPTKHTPYFEMVDAQAKAGCPVCRLVYRTTDRYLDSLLYEAVLDPAVRDRLKYSHGFCREHVDMLRGKPGRSLGVALIYETILRRLTDIADQGRLEQGSLMDRIKGQPRTGRSFEQALTAEERCPACLIQEKAVENCVEVLVTFIDDEKLYDAYVRGEGLCLPHLAATIARAQDEETLARLVRPQLARYRVMLDELSEYIRKHDHRFKGEAMGEEGDVWLRVMNAIAGGAGMGLSAKHGAHRARDIGSRDR